MLKGIIFDFMRTLYNPEKGELFDGVLPMLTSFKEKGIKQGLVSFGGGEKRRLLFNLGLTSVFDWYRVVEDKTPEVFQDFLSKFSLKPEEVLVVGDLVNKEVAIGKRIGAKTVWINHESPFANPREFMDIRGENSWYITPDYTIDNIAKLSEIVGKLAY